MEIVITHTSTETSVTLLNNTDFSNPPVTPARGDYASIMYVKNITDGSILDVTQGNPLLNNTYILNDLTNGNYKAELLMIPEYIAFKGYAEENQPYEIPVGLIIYYSGLFYRCIVSVTDTFWDLGYPTPDIDTTHWEVLDTTDIESVYDEVFQLGMPAFAQTYYGFHDFSFHSNIDVDIDVIIKNTINKTSVVLDISETIFSPVYRSDYAALMYVNNKKTTGNVPITGLIPNPSDPLSTVTWTIDNPVDGYYKAELLMIPNYQYMVDNAALSGNDIFAGTITYYNSIFYRAINQIVNPWDSTPDTDYNNWEEINTTCIENVYDEALQATLPSYAQTFYGFDEFVFFNNLMYAFLDLSAAITKSCNICANPQIELLRCLRDKYESVELAIAANNYSGAQTIIESSQNLVNCCSC